jgi:hypothetical protein
MTFKVFAYLFAILVGFLAGYVEYDYRKSVKANPREKSLARDITSVSAYLMILFAIYSFIMLVVNTFS